MISPNCLCNECGALKGEGNRWFELRRTTSGAPYFREWTLDAEQPGTEHICGEKCAHAVLSKYLTALREQVREEVAA
jgi:hypothetical protein